MDINLYPVRREKSLIASKRGQVLTVNGASFDFSRMADGDSLPASALASEWITGSVDNVAGNLSLTLILPLPANFSPEQAFPKPLFNLSDGEINFPKSLEGGSDGLTQAAVPVVEPEKEGKIDWSQLVTASMKVELSAAANLSHAKVELTARSAIAATQIARIHDRVQTIGYGIDAGEATAEDEAEQSSLMISLKVWKGYKFALGKIPSLPSWPADPSWPAEPWIPDIEAAPMAKSQGDI